MDKRPDQQTGGQYSQPAAFPPSQSSDQVGNAQPQSPQPPANVPPPLTPSPQTPYPGYPVAPSGPGPQYATGYGNTRMPPLPQTPPQPGFSPIVQRLPENSRRPLSKPFPFRLSLLIALGCIALLVAVFGLRVLALGGDWSEGVSAVGTVALLLAAVAALGILLRLAAGRRSLGFIMLSLVLLVALAGTGIGSLASSGPLHQAQAQAMETNGQWSTAIREYSLSGQQGPNAPDIARVYDKWGEQLLQQHDYKGALTRFQTVLDDYGDSDAAVARARNGQYLTYVAWMKTDAAHVLYRNAIIVFVNYASSASCTGECKATLAEVTPQAYYLYAMQLVGQKHYAQAIAEFTKLAAGYGSSNYAKQAHTKAAAAYFIYGQQQISNKDCSGAITSYKTLVANYKDTPEAAKAQTALNAPQNVRGSLIAAPTNPSPTVHLSKSMNFRAFYFSDEYSTSIDPRTGGFTFKQVAQGTYYFSTSRPVGAGSIDYEAWWADETHTRYFSFTVMPLCTTELPAFHV
ncbi:MAG TPA: hypothetical protein VFU63_14815 [Ktedonobacterales bacterium]|nr:hypothetical protein [Ktedonobacterales bacterium]